MGAESVFQSDRLYYDKVDAHGFIYDISSSQSPSLGPSVSMQRYGQDLSSLFKEYIYKQKGIKAPCWKL